MLDESHKENTIPILKYSWEVIDHAFLKYFKVYQMFYMYYLINLYNNLMRSGLLFTFSGAVK